MRRKRSSAVSQLQLLVSKPGRERLILAYHASMIGGHLGRNRTLAQLSQRFYWSGMADDVGDWLRNCTTCMKSKSPAGRHHPLGNIPAGHHWDRIAMDILDVCDPTLDGFRYILVIANYFSNGPKRFQLRTNVLIVWRTCWWIKSSYALECPSLSTMIRVGSSRTD